MSELEEIEGNNSNEKLGNLRKFKFVKIQNVLFKVGVSNDIRGDGKLYWSVVLRVFPEENTSKFFNGVNIGMSICDNIRISGVIQRSQYVSGTKMLSIMDEICIWLKLDACYIIDESTISCGNKKIDLKLLLLLADAETYYEKRGFHNYEITDRKHNYYVNEPDRNGLWDKFMNIRNTQLSKLITNYDFNIILELAKKYDISYSRDITLSQLFADIKSRNCDYQYDMFQIFDFHVISPGDVTSRNDWKSIVMRVYNMRTPMVKYYKFS